MANTAMQLGQAALSTLSTLYTVGAGKKAILKSFDICSTIAQQVFVRVFLVPSGGTAGTSNALLYDYPIPGNGVFGWEGEQVLPEGASIQVYGAPAGCTITVSGIEIA